jgi:transcriptional regulator with XRE-family HTH domain
MISSSLSNPNKILGIGARISQVRFPLSETVFADSLGIYRNALRQYEKEEQLPDAKLLMRIHDIYGVDPIWLLTGKSAKIFTHRSQNHWPCMD